MNKNITYVFGEHKEKMPPDVVAKSNQIETCILCDEPIFLTGNGIVTDGKGKGINESELPKNAESKYFATSCFMQVNQVFGMMMIREMQTLHDLNCAANRHGEGEEFKN